MPLSKHYGITQVYNTLLMLEVALTLRMLNIDFLSHLYKILRNLELL
jgi:hypothetical protein